VTHRDLKLENLMLRSRDAHDLNSVTVIDFGLAKAVRARERMEDACGTLWYYAPELVRGVPFLPVVDEWALGVCMHLLLSGEFPFDDEDEDVLEDLILEADLSKIRDAESGENTSVWSSVSADARDLLLGLLNPAPMKRLTAQAALEHSFFGAHSGDSGTLWHGL
jgi:serine/threonine protein kinase